MGGQAQAMRQKRWDELSSDQKIETLRDEIRHLARGLVQADKVIVKLINHQHANGQIVAPMGHPNEESYGSVISLPYSLRNGLTEGMV